jgi:hypothetical protein
MIVLEALKLSKKDYKQRAKLLKCNKKFIFCDKTPIPLV